MAGPLEFNVRDFGAQSLPEAGLQAEAVRLTGGEIAVRNFATIAHAHNGRNVFPRCSATAVFPDRRLEGSASDAPGGFDTRRRRLSVRKIGGEKESRLA